MKLVIYSLTLLSLSLTGCVVTIDSDYQSSSNWNDMDVDHIEIGETNKDWVLSAIGKPNTKRTRSDGTEVWRYKNVSERDTRIGILLLLHMNVERERHKYLHVEFKDDVVIDYWMESDWSGEH